jgi:hypothetical protein
MIKLFQFLIDGCWHKWEIIDTANYYKSPDMKEHGPYGRVEFCQCTRCGMPKRFNLYEDL